MYSSNSNNDNNEPDQEARLRSLGYSDDELQRSKKQSSQEEPLRVNVNTVDNVDSVSLTAVGFGLIAFNFFVLANMGDGGLGGVLATIINKMNE